MNDFDSLRALLAPADPARDLLPDPETRQRVLETARSATPATSATRGRILGPAREGAAPVRVRPVRRGRLAVRLAVAAGVALAAGAVGVKLVDGTPTSLTPTPPMLVYVGAQSEKPQQILERIAANADRSPDTIGTKRYFYSKSEGWALNSRIGGGRTASWIEPSAGEGWWAADGSWRKVWTEGKKVHDERGGPGSRTAAEMWDVAKLSADPKKLKRQLAVGHPGDGTERLVAVSDLYRIEPIRPRLAAAVLRSLKDVRGLVYSGRVTDRDGRTGQAFSVESRHGGLPNRHTLIFDPATGTLLAEEELLTTDAGKLNIKVPAVIGYEMWLRSGTTDSVDERP